MSQNIFWFEQNVIFNFFTIFLKSRKIGAILAHRSPCKVVEMTYIKEPCFL